MARTNSALVWSGPSVPVYFSTSFHKARRRGTARLRNPTHSHGGSSGASVATTQTVNQRHTVTIDLRRDMMTMFLSSTEQTFDLPLLQRTLSSEFPGAGPSWYCELERADGGVLPRPLRPLRVTSSDNNDASCWAGHSSSAPAEVTSIVGYRRRDGRLQVVAGGPNRSIEVSGVSHRRPAARADL